MFIYLFRSREIDDLSKEAFTDVGNQLQKRRQKDFVSTFQMPGAEVNAFRYVMSW